MCLLSHCESPELLSSAYSCALSWGLGDGHLVPPGTWHRADTQHLLLGVGKSMSLRVMRQMLWGTVFTQAWGGVSVSRKPPRPKLLSLSSPDPCHYRWALHLWRENTMARLDGAKKTSQARVHYSRTLCSKVRYILVTREPGAHITVLINWHLVRTSQGR